MNEKKEYSSEVTKPIKESEEKISSGQHISVCKRNSVLLQTARAQISTTDESRVVNARLLFDSGSQLSYISPKARAELQLPSLEKQEVVIKVFGSVQSSKMLDVVKFAVKSRDNNMKIYVTAFASDSRHDDGLCVQWSLR